ncbi:MAG: hypothetical protein H7145_07285 [Akkermansiaceae bacterium]|nr:hypothetical protein [Armatimonadota bacterium]
MRHDNRRSATKVVAGRVRTKNNRTLSMDYYDAPEPRTVSVDRKRPGQGYKHILHKSDIYRFIELLPDWKNLAIGLNAIVLAPGSSTMDGYHVPGVVHVCAWEAEMWREYPSWYYE